MRISQLQTSLVMSHYNVHSKTSKQILNGKSFVRGLFGASKDVLMF